jgi:hypothetical protein
MCDRVLVSLLAKPLTSIIPLYLYKIITQAQVPSSHNLGCILAQKWGILDQNYEEINLGEVAELLKKFYYTLLYKYKVRELLFTQLHFILAKLKIKAR